MPLAVTAPPLHLPAVVTNERQSIRVTGDMKTSYNFSMLIPRGLETTVNPDNAVLDAMRSAGVIAGPTRRDQVDSQGLIDDARDFGFKPITYADQLVGSFRTAREDPAPLLEAINSLLTIQNGWDAAAPTAT